MFDTVSSKISVGARVVLPFASGLASAAYFFPMLKALEIGAGLLLLWGRLVPFALVVLAPIVVHIAAFHLFLAPGGLGLVALIVAATLTVAWTHRASFRPLFVSSRPNVPAPTIREMASPARAA